MRRDIFKEGPTGHVLVIIIVPEQVLTTLYLRKTASYLTFPDPSRGTIRHTSEDWLENVESHQT